MSRTFLNGSLAEKARVANTLLCELLGGLPDDVLREHRKDLHAGSSALQEIQAKLRMQDYTDGEKP